MLMQIEIKNIAIIDYTLVDFNDGFHVLTGETGAGKSIILDSIGLLTGERAQKELIRKGEEQAVVRGVLSINEENREIIERVLGHVEDDYITIERTISKDGKGTAKINGRVEPLKNLKEIVMTTLEICGQKSHIDLMKEAYYRELLDSAGNKKLKETLSHYQEEYQLWKRKRKELEKWQKNDREQEQMLDLYHYQIQEIEEMGLKVEEEEELEREIKKLGSYEELQKACAIAVNMLDNIDWGSVEKATELMMDTESEYQSLHDRVISMNEEIKDIRYEMSRYESGLEYDELTLDKMVYRHEEIKKMKRKYGPSVESILLYLEEIKEKVDQYDRKEEVIQNLEHEIKKIEIRLEKEAKTLHEERKSVALELSKDIQLELRDLAMPHAEFSINVSYVEEWNEYGKDDVQAFFNANKGEEMRPLNKIASGGEMARVLLAIKVISNERTPGKTLIFDEVDEGIGGDVGRIIGQKMYRLGQKTQVVVISHLPQVASKASHHYQIVKHVKENRTYSTIDKLSEGQRVDEISRMLYGKGANEVTKEQAKRMLAKDE